MIEKQNKGRREPMQAFIAIYAGESMGISVNKLKFKLKIISSRSAYYAWKKLA